MEDMKKRLSGTIITFGLNESENKIVKENLPTKDYELLETDVPTDLIALPATALIINGDALDDEGTDLLSTYYMETYCYINETVFWIGKNYPSFLWPKMFHCYDNFEQVTRNLKYHLLTAHNKVKSAKNFSEKLADCIKILSLIRLNPGIKTQKLADEIERSTRTVQRYIATLQATGEWIEYDCKKKGWYLMDGISILLGDI